MATLAIPYWRLSRRVDKQLAAGPFLETYSYYAAATPLSVGDQESPSDVVAALRHAGLRDASGDQTHSFTETASSVVVHDGTPVRIDFAGSQVRAITDLAARKRLNEYDLPPQLITNLSDSGRQKRIIVHYSDLPPILIEAILSAEDKRFFKHDGLDAPRILKAMYVDFKDRRKEQGASTITMQLARNLWLDRDKSWKRKVAESLITLHLERKLSKEQILEFYCNQVYLGSVGTYSIDGFGEAARAYFNKDIRKLDVTEAALLAGMIQRPSYFNPLRYPNRTMQRRNVVLARMRENGYLSAAEYERAVAAPVTLHPSVNEMSETQFFLDMAGDQLQGLMEGHEGGAANIYTTLDPRLQQAAEKAVQDGMRLVDRELSKGRKKKSTAKPQVALIALDPHTGEVKAIIGGRDYAASQLNRLLAKRPPGSVFKPFVYATAIETAINGGPQVFTPASTVIDSPTTFQFENQTYSPGNFKNEFMGQVTLRKALANSLNVATVKLAQAVGFDNIAALAHRMGLNENIRPTPAMALGAYSVTPLEIAGAYTAFANGGVRVSPDFIESVRDPEGDSIYDYQPRSDQVIDPRVAFVMTDMMQEVLRSGTGAAVRSMGFRLPAAGKTGTSHDGWFAGYTSRLLCVVWVGFDDYSALGLEGSRSALPIWTEFMEQAARYREYGDAGPFVPPAGVVKVAINPASGKLAGPYCPDSETDYFIEGTQPAATCPEPQPQHEFFPAEADRAVPAPGQEAAPVVQPMNQPPVTATPAPQMPARTPYAAPRMPARTPPAARQMPARTPPPAAQMPVRTPSAAPRFPARTPPPPPPARPPEP